MKVSRWMLSPLLLLQGVLVSSSSLGKYINTPCTAASDCGLNTHLQCINNYCQCDSFTQIYDQSTHKCLLLLGQQCQAVSGTTSEKHHHHYQQTPPVKCVPHADCTKSAVGKPPVCKCKTGYKPSVDFLCKPDYGSQCYAHDDCDDGQGLVCAQGICQCFNSTWSYQGQFGCVDPNNPQYNEMLRLLNQTEYLLKENNLELKDMFNDLGLQNDPDTADFTISNVLASARQFQDTYNTNDLQFAAQNQNSQQTGGGRFNLQQLLTLFQTFQNLIPRNNGGGGGGGGGGGFLRNLFRGGRGGGGGYPESSTPAPSGYSASGQPEGMGQRMGLLNSFLNLFNQMIPIVRQLRMRFSPVRFIQNLIMRFSPTTAAPPPAPAAIHNAPPTIITANGNYQSNPIFDNNSGQEQQGNSQGSLRFFMRTRQRFRNFLRGNNAGGGGGYDYTPANPPDKYGPPKYGPPPAKGYGPPGETPPPAEGGGDAPPPAEAPPADGAGTSQQNYYTNNPRAGFRAGTAQYSTVHVSPGGGSQQQHEIPQSAPAPSQRQQSFSNGASPNSFNSGQHPNPQSFFSSQANNQHDNQQYNSNYNSNQNSFNAQATSHHQSTFLPHPQPSNNLPQLSHSPSPPIHQNNIFDSSTNSFVRPPVVPSITASPPPPIPQFKLQVPQNAHGSTHESLSQNFILSEADDPHPGFTPLSTPEPSAAEQHHQGFRTSARFERIGQEEQQQPNTAAQNWRETF